MFKRIISSLAALVISATLLYAHGDATHLAGTITAIEGDHIQIKDTGGKTVLVMLQKTTKFMKADKPSAKSELKVGTRVLIDAKMDEKMKMYAAQEVSIGVTTTAKPAAPKAGVTKTR